LYLVVNAAVRRTFIAMEKTSKEFNDMSAEHVGFDLFGQVICHAGISSAVL
jgi:hypothetical protein